MGNSWNHRILNADDLTGFGRVSGETAKKRINDVRSSNYNYTCSARNCDVTPSFVCAYNYITGRGGRTGLNERVNCIGHTLKFAKKHGIELPTKDYYGNSIQQPTAAECH